MSNEILTVSLEVLGDGQVKAITNKGNQEVFLQPVIFVDSKEPNLRLEIKGSRGNQVRVSTDISSIDGVAFSGTFEELETALREMARTANGLRVGGSSGGGGGGNVVVTNNVDPSTSTKQDAQISIITDMEDNTKRKTVGNKVELANDLLGLWSGFPVSVIALTLSINGDDTVYPMNDVESFSNKDLVQQLNNSQKVLVFDWVEGSIDIVFNGVTVSNPEVNGILIEDNNSGLLGYSTFAASTDEATGAVQQLVNLMQQQLQVSKGAPLAPKASRLVNPSSQTITGFKYLVFSCDGANNSITATQNGTSVTYPQSNLDGSLLRGYELPLSKVPYINSITFNGTGTVDILKID
jgi:hypothetical protein